MAIRAPGRERRPFRAGGFRPSWSKRGGAFALRQTFIMLSFFAPTGGVEAMRTRGDGLDGWETT